MVSGTPYLSHDNLHRHTRQYSGRWTQSFTDQNAQMVIRPHSLSQSLQLLGISEHQYVCNPQQHQMRHILFKSRNWTWISGRCPNGQLVQKPHIYVASHPTSPPNHIQDQTSPRQCNPHCSTVAKTTLVHTAEIHEQQPSSPLSNSTPALSAMVCFHQIW